MTEVYYYLVITMHSINRAKGVLFESEITVSIILPTGIVRVTTYRGFAPSLFFSRGPNACLPPDLNCLLP
jgi:hypothetical protein